MSYLDFPKRKIKFIRPDLDVLKEILNNELDGVKYQNNDCSDFELEPFYYKSNKNGPVLKRSTYFEIPIQFTKPGNSKDFNEVQLGYLLNLDKIDDDYDIYQAFMLQNKVRLE